jgi:hypothetical protein
MTPLVELQFDFGRMFSYIPYLMQKIDSFRFANKVPHRHELIATASHRRDLSVMWIPSEPACTFLYHHPVTAFVVDLSAMNDTLVRQYRITKSIESEVQKGSQ